MHRFAVVLVSVLVSAGCATAGLDEPAPDAAIHADARVVVSTPDAFIANQFPDAQLTIDAPVRIDAPLAVIDAPSFHPDAHPSSPDASLPIDARPHADAFVPPPTPDAFVPPPTPDAPTGGGCTTMELLGNGNFDSTTGDAADSDVQPAPWTEESAAGSELIYTASDLSAADAPVSPQSGNYASWMGGDGGTDILYQMVTVPAGATSLVLTGYVQIFPSEAGDDDLTFNLFAAGDPSAAPLETINQYTDDDSSSSWQQFSFSASQAYAGQTLVITVQSDTDTDEPASFFVDTLSLQATVCP